MNSYNNPFYKSLLGISEIDNVFSANINTQSITVGSLGTGLVSSTSGTLQNAVAVVPLSYTSANNQLAIALTGSTGVTYDIVGNVGRFAFSPLTGATGPQGIQGFTGPVGALGPTGYTGPIGLPGAGGTIGYYANYFSNTTQTINATDTQITFPLNFVQNGVSLDGSSNITFDYPGTYQITGEFQVDATNNSVFTHWYKLNGVDIANSSFTNNFSGGAGQLLSTSSGLLTANAGDKVGIFGIKTSGTVSLSAAPSSVSPAYPASPSVNVVVSQITYTQIGPTGYTGPQSLITSNFNVFGGVNAGISRTTATGNVGLGYRSLESLTTSLNNTAVGTDSLRLLTSTTVPGSNTAVGFASLSQCSTGVQNTAIGSGSGRNLTTGRFNTLVGMSSGLNLTTGDTNSHLGLNSGLSNRSGGDNISIGAYSMAKGANFMTGPNGRNIGIGHYALHSIEGSSANNVAVGYQALWNATDGASDNICIGTNSGVSIVTNGGGNIAIGGSSTSVGGTLTNGQGYNVGLGLASNLYLSANASNNIGIGAYSNFNTSTGINNISIGPFTQALSATGCNNIVLSTNGTISAPISGKGDNTALIDSTNGLYYYSPATAYLTSTGLSNGRVQWVNSETNNPIKGFTLGNLGNGPNTVIVPNKQGLYQIDVSGTVLGSGSAIFGTWNNVNIRNYNTFFQAASVLGTIYQMGFTVQSRPYTVVSLSGFELNITNATWYSGLPLTASIRFISL